MRYEQKHRIAEKVVDSFRTKVQRTHADLFCYPLSLTALSVMISETYPIAVHEITRLDIQKIHAMISRCGGSFTPSVLDAYTALVGFLYAHRGGGMIFIEREDSEERRKFSLAHELAHFLNDYYEPFYLRYEASNTIPLFAEDRTALMQQVVAARCSERDIYGDHAPEVKRIASLEVKKIVQAIRREERERFNEIRANLFAAELLMPLEECKRIEHECLKTNLDIATELIKRFGVSRQAARYRVQELQLGAVEEELFDGKMGVPKE